MGHFGSVDGDLLHVCSLLGLRPDPEQVAAATRVRLEVYRRFWVPRSGAIETLAAIRDAGLRLGLISDCGSEVPRVWPETPFAPLFEVALFSCVVGVCKPDPAIYRLACARLGVAPEHCLYVGDGGSRELTGAAALRMHPVLIRAGEIPPDDPRADAREWAGTTITHLSEVLALAGVGR